MGSGGEFPGRGGHSLLDLNLGDVMEVCLPPERALKDQAGKMLAGKGQGQMWETVACLFWKASEGVASP